MDKLTRTMVEAARKAKPVKSRGQALSGIFVALQSHLALDKVKQVAVVEDAGRFWGNVHLDTPQGFPDVLGTPDARPRASREEALKDLRGILQLIRVAELMRMSGEEATTSRIFEIDHVSIEITQEQFLDIGAIRPAGGEAEVNLHLATLDGLVEAVTGGEALEKEALMACSDAVRGAVVLMAGRLLLHGVFRHRTLGFQGRDPLDGHTDLPPGR